jgi:hypothetical protein
VAAALDAVAAARVLNAEQTLRVPEGTTVVAQNVLRTATWRTQPRALAASQRALALLLARCDAGTLFAPLTLVERRALGMEAETHAQQEVQEDPSALPGQRASQLFAVASDAAQFWPPLSDPAAEEARLRGVAAAARAALVCWCCMSMASCTKGGACAASCSLRRLLQW